MTLRQSFSVRIFGAAAIAIMALVIILAVTRSAGSSSVGCQTQSHTHTCTVLFIGNSYTYANDLPRMFERLAATGHHLTQTGILAAANASLSDHAISPATLHTMATRRWNIVVLQEQSQIPASNQLRQQHMYPATRRLVHIAQADKTQPILFLTWAHRQGWPEARLPSYASMQTAIDNGYLTVAKQLHIAVAPVSYAWSATLNQLANSHLWLRDGSHPTVEGTYLAACVFYATIFQKSPEGLTYHAELPNNQATRLQAIASKAVLADPTRWGIR